MKKTKKMVFLKEVVYELTDQQTRQVAGGKNMTAMTTGTRTGNSRTKQAE